MELSIFVTTNVVIWWKRSIPVVPVAF